MLPRIEDRAKSWQHPGPRRWLVFALFGALVALSSALLLSIEEAQAKAKGSPSQGPVEKAIGGSDKPVQKDNGGAPTSPRGRETAKDAAAKGSTPRVHKPASVDAEPKPSAAERAGKASEEVSRPVLKEEVKSGDDSVPDKTASAADSALKEVPSAAEPVLKEADNPAVEPALLKEAAPAVEPILGETTPAIKPVLAEATSEIGPVLEGAAPQVEPVLEEATSPVEPVLEGTPSVVEPVLDSAAPAVDLFDGAAEPVASPLLEAASPAETVEPVPEEVVSPAVVVPVLEETLPPAGPGLEETAPPAEPSSETASPAIEALGGAATPGVEPILETAAPATGIGEAAVSGNVELPAPEKIEHTILAVPPVISSHAPVVDVETRGALQDPLPAPAALRDARKSSSPGSADEIWRSTVGLLGSYFEPFGRSSMVDGHRAIPSDVVVAQGSQGWQQRPGPLGFPSGMPPPAGSSSLGGSGPGVALDLLGILALFLILSRAGRSSWSSLGAFKPDSSLQLVVERPG